jgi:hypothetical protein
MWTTEKRIYTQRIVELENDEQSLKNLKIQLQELMAKNWNETNELLT